MTRHHLTYATGDLRRIPGPIGVAAACSFDVEAVGENRLFFVVKVLDEVDFELGEGPMEI